jgi:hypothetical protein
MENKKTEKLKKTKEIKPKKKNGGARPGAGRKKSALTLLHEKVEKHGFEEISAKITGKDGQPTGKLVKKARVLFLLDRFFIEATKPKDPNIEAGKEYLRRILGMPAPSVRVEDSGQKSAKTGEKTYRIEIISAE